MLQLGCVCGNIFAAELLLWFSCWMQHQTDDPCTKPIKTSLIILKIHIFITNR